MATPKIVLFYVFTPLPDPEAIRLWQHTLAESLGLTGRVIVSKDGINATLGGDIREVKAYVRATKSYARSGEPTSNGRTGRAMTSRG